MRMNTRFTVAVHMMTLVALGKIKRGDKPITSEHMARSVSTSPVVVRRITAMLKKAGLVEVKAGVGGSSLKRAPKDITLLDIYNAVKLAEDDTLFEVHSHPNLKCWVGAHILDSLSPSLMDAQQAMEGSLANHTLKDILLPIAEKNQIQIE